MAPHMSFLVGDMSLLLGEHLLPAMKEKIYKGEFFNFFLLLYRELQKKDKQDLDEKEKEMLKCRKVDRNWSNWVAGFLIYAGVIAKMQPWRATTLFQYFDMIYKAFTGFSGHAYLQYDEEFRIWTTMNPILQWDQVYTPCGFKYCHMHGPTWATIHTVDTLFTGSARFPLPALPQVRWFNLASCGGSLDLMVPVSFHHANIGMNAHCVEAPTLSLPF